MDMEEAGNKVESSVTKSNVIRLDHTPLIASFMYPILVKNRWNVYIFVSIAPTFSASGVENGLKIWTKYPPQLDHFLPITVYDQNFRGGSRGGDTLCTPLRTNKFCLDRLPILKCFGKIP